MLTNQDAFTKALTGVLAQQSLSTDGEGCRYRLQIPDKMLKCGIGHCLPDALYKPEWDTSNGESGTCVCTLYKTADFRDALGPVESLLFLSELQYAHDDAARQGNESDSPEVLANFKRNMKALAFKWNLTYVD